MLTRRQRVALLALLTALSMINVIDRVDAQTGSVRISTDLELIGLGDLSGGGHITWTLTGDQARILRDKIVHMFDEYGAIPRGFAYPRSPVPAVEDGTLGSTEALAYTALLENEVEGIRYAAPGFGSEVRYVMINAADILESRFPVERSSEGLVGTGANSTARLEIRFINNAYTVSQNWRFRFSDVALANALHRVFDFSQAMGEFAPEPWAPVRVENGWHSVLMADGMTALWHGNDATWSGNPLLGRYDNSTAMAAHTYLEPGLNETDLRFATWANVSFRYIGRADGPADRLRLEVGPGTSNVTWTDLTNEDGDTVLPDTAAWRTVRYNVTGYAGQMVRFRLNFTSDATGNNAPGFFIRGFGINAPSRFEGTIESAETDYLVGTLSFQDFDIVTGRANLIRTPAGEILTYGASYNANAISGDSARFRGFDFFENPQTLFIVLIVTAYLTSWFQDKIFAGYRARHPLKYRPGAGRIPWLVWIARVFIILFVLFYFVPSFFALFGATNAFITGPIFWAFSIASTAGLAIGTWLLYEHRSKFIPPEEETFAPAAPLGEGVPPPPPELEDLARQRMLTCAHCRNEIVDLKAALKCRCGQVYHESCALEIGRCPNCQREFDVSRPAEKRMVTAKCPSCGEIQIVAETADLMQTRCEACGALLQEIQRGYNYLVLAPENDLALEWFHSIVKKDVPGLAMSTTFQEKLRKEFGFEGVDLYWLTDTDTGPKSIDPKRIDFEMMRALSNFIKRTKGGAVLLDGLEYLVVENSFDRVLKFIKKVNDLASVHEVTLIIPVTAGSLGSDELTLLRKEFDRVIETSGRAGPVPPKP